MRLKNEPLSKHTTLRIGGPAEVLSVPSSESALIKEIKHCKKNKIPYKILGNGSNVLVNDSGIKGFVIKNTKACSKLSLKNGIVEAGSSVKLQKLIKFCVEHNLGGIEFLYSVPGTVGGAVYMNAGRGKSTGLWTSKFIESVKIFDGSKTMIIKKSQCKYDYRKSIFQQHPDWVILSAKLKLPKQLKDVGEEKIKQRLEHAKQHQDWSYPNAGSTFKHASYVVLWLVRGLRIGNAKFSRKSANWVQNLGNAKAKDVMKLVGIVKFLDKLFFKKTILEIRLW